MTTLYLTGENTPEIIQSFETFEQIKEHFLETKNIAYHRNSYSVLFNGNTVVNKKISDIESEQDLLAMYEEAIKKAQTILLSSSSTENKTQFSNDVKTAQPDSAVNKLISIGDYQLRHYSGGSLPEKIHKFTTLHNVSTHFLETKNIAYSKNSYTVMKKDGHGLTRNIGTIQSPEELRSFIFESINQLESFTIPAHSRGVSEYDLIRNKKICSANTRSLRKFLKTNKSTLALTVVGACAGVAAGGAGLAFMGSAYSVPGYALGATAGNVAGNAIDTATSRN